VLDYAFGDGMTIHAHDDVYRVAYDTANTELGEIVERFEQLRTRKDQIERLVAALKPVVEEDAEAAAAEAHEEEAHQEEAQPIAVAQTAEDSFNSADESQEMRADPFQRRIDHVLGIGAGIRDVRKYSRQF
jgi:hypothetical protein